MVSRTVNVDKLRDYDYKRYHERYSVSVRCTNRDIVYR